MTRYVKELRLKCIQTAISRCFTALLELKLRLQLLFQLSFLHAWTSQLCQYFKEQLFFPFISHRVEQSLSKFYFQRPACCGCLDISISNDMEAVSKRYAHPLHSSQQASKPPGSRLRHATGGGYAVKWHYCHLSVPSASLSLQTPAHLASPSAATCCRHRAATMGCHLVMNPEGARHWFKVPLPSAVQRDCRNDGWGAGRFSLAPSTDGAFSHSKCYWVNAVYAPRLLDNKGESVRRDRLVYFLYFSFGSFWSLNPLQESVLMSYFWGRK